MAIFDTNTGKAIARGAAVAAATGCAALAVAGPASAAPVLRDQYIEVPNCNTHRRTVPNHPHRVRWPRNRYWGLIHRQRQSLRRHDRAPGKWTRIWFRCRRGEPNYRHVLCPPAQPQQTNDYRGAGRGHPGRLQSRTALVATVTGCAALALAGPASAGPDLSRDAYIEVANCTGGGQWCPPDPSAAPGMKFPTRGVPDIKVEFRANQNHCADMIAHIFVDGREWGSNVVHPGQSDGGYEIPVSDGAHTIQVQAQGLPGGCNTGSVSAWGGNLHVEALPNG